MTSPGITELTLQRSGSRRNAIQNDDSNRDNRTTTIGISRGISVTSSSPSECSTNHSDGFLPGTIFEH